MQDQLQNKINELKKESEKGQTRLRELQTQQLQLHETMLRIEGALLVLNELLEKSDVNKENKDSSLESVKTGTKKESGK